jgi:hypothetical protein
MTGRNMKSAEAPTVGKVPSLPFGFFFLGAGEGKYDGKKT